MEAQKEEEKEITCQTKIKKKIKKNDEKEVNVEVAEKEKEKQNEVPVKQKGGIKNPLSPWPRCCDLVMDEFDEPQQLVRPGIVQVRRVGTQPPTKEMIGQYPDILFVVVGSRSVCEFYQSEAAEEEQHKNVLPLFVVFTEHPDEQTHVDEMILFLDSMERIKAYCRLHAIRHVVMPPLPQLFLSKSIEEHEFMSSELKEFHEQVDKENSGYGGGIDWSAVKTAASVAGPTAELSSKQRGEKWNQAVVKQNEEIRKRAVQATKKKRVGFERPKVPGGTVLEVAAVKVSAAADKAMREYEKKMSALNATANEKGQQRWDRRYRRAVEDKDHDTMKALCEERDAAGSGLRPASPDAGEDQPAVHSLLDTKEQCTIS